MLAVCCPPSSHPSLKVHFWGIALQKLQKETDITCWILQMCVWFPAQQCGIHSKQQCYPLAFGVPAALMFVALSKFDSFHWHKEISASPEKRTQMKSKWHIHGYLEELWGINLAFHQAKKSTRPSVALWELVDLKVKLYLPLLFQISQKTYHNLKIVLPYQQIYL